MVGTSPLGPARGDILQGDATLVFGLGDTRTMQVAFTNIVNLDRREPHRVPGLVFEDVPVAADGTYRQDNRPGDRIQGAFHGPDQAETAGIFERLNIVGAFGARRK